MSATDSPPEGLSTHPSSETRQLILDILMPTAIQLRDQCKVRPAFHKVSFIGFGCFLLAPDMLYITINCTIASSSVHVSTIVGFNPLFTYSKCVQIPVTLLNAFCMVAHNIFSITFATLFTYYLTTTFIFWRK